MAAPTNTTAATATDLGTLPVTYGPQEAHDSGTTYDLWFKLTIPSGVNMIGAWAYGNFSTWNPVLAFWREATPGDVGSIFQVGASALSVPTQWAVTAGDVVYFRTRKPSGNPNPAQTTITVEAGPRESVPVGSILINDSTSGFPAVFISATDGHPLRYLHPFPAGESVAVLQDGTVMMGDIDLDGMRIYNSAYSLVAIPTMPAAGYVSVLGTNQIDGFWAGKSNDGGVAKIVHVTAAGVTWTPISLGSTGLQHVAPNADDSKVYFSKDISTPNQPLYVVDTSSAVVSTFLAGVPNYFFGANHITLTDDTVLVPYERVGFDSYIERRSAAGALLNTYTLTGVQNAIERLFAEPDDPAYFGVWTQGVGTTTFSKIRVSDGVIVNTVTGVLFQEGVSQESATPTPTARFGSDFSCVPITTRTLSSAPPTLPTQMMDNSIPCCDDRAPGEPHPGPVPPFVSPAWTPDCIGGGDLYDDADDPTDPEFWDDPVSRTADTWMEFRLARYPASAGTLILRYATRPFADEGSYKEGRLISLSRGRRACTDPDGNYEIGRVTAVLSDGDGYFRTLLDEGAPEEYFANREATIYTATESARKAGLKRRRFRGHISNVKLLSGRQVQIDIADAIGSQFSGFNLEKAIGTQITVAEHPNAPEDTLSKIYPILAGERSDKGALDIAGGNAEKGVEPALDCGDRDITGAERPPGIVLPPINFSVTVVGTPGTKTQTYAVTAITALGETLPTEAITITNAPDVRDAVNYVRLTWDHADAFSEANTIAFRVLGRGTNPPTTWLDGMNNGGTWINPETEYHDDHDQDVEKGLPDLGLVGTALADDYTFSFMLLSIGYGYDILSVFGSNVPDGGEPKRINLSAEYGVTIIRPQDASWPHADPWIEAGGIRQFGFYARGNVLKHHRNGSCTLSVNICGPHDADELVVDQVGKQDVWFLNEHVLKNNGTGYRSGSWGPLEAYDNGDTILNKTQWDAAQDITVDWIGGLGYLADISIHEPITVAEFLRRRTVAFGWRYVADHHGRIRPVVINDLADPALGRHIRDRIEIKRNDDDTLAWDEVLNRIEYTYHWDADAGVYRALNQSTEHDISIAAHVPGGVTGGADRRGVKKQVRELWGVNDPVTAVDSQSRELLRRRRRPRYVKDVVDLMALDYEIGDQFRRTHYEGLGVNGDVATPMLCEAMEEDYDKNEIALLLQDMRGILPDAIVALGDEAGSPVDADVLGDEDDEPPTAMELH